MLLPASGSIESELPHLTLKPWINNPNLTAFWITSIDNLQEHKNLPRSTGKLINQVFIHQTWSKISERSTINLWLLNTRLMAPSPNAVLDPKQ